MTRFVKPRVTDTQVRKAIKAIDKALWESDNSYIRTDPGLLETHNRFVERGWSWGYPMDPDVPVIVWEEGPYEWAIAIAGSDVLEPLGLRGEPGTGFALNLYPKEKE